MKTYNPIPAMEESRWGDGEYVLKSDAEEEIADREAIIERLSDQIVELNGTIENLTSELLEARNYE